MSPSNAIAILEVETGKFISSISADEGTSVVFRFTDDGRTLVTVRLNPAGGLGGRLFVRMRVETR